MGTEAEAPLNFVLVGLASDRSEAVIEVRPAPAKLFKLTAASCERLLQFLSDVRENLLPVVEEKWEDKPGASITAKRDPDILANTDVLTGDVILHIRDPGFGWRHFVLPKDYARAVGEGIIRRADEPAPPTPRH